MKWLCLAAFLILPAAPFAANSVQPSSAPRYDTQTVKDFTGVVVGVREDDAGAALPGIHLSVKEDQETFDVYLAPVSFLKLFDVEFAKGDQVQVNGSKVKCNDETVVLAKEVRRGDTTVYLRDDAGKPFWTH